MHWFLRSALPLCSLLLLLTSACDTQCVGPGCLPEDDGLADGDELADDDDSAAGGHGGGEPQGVGDERLQEPVDLRDCHVIREHRPSSPATSVQIAGEFSSWQPLDMKGPNDEGWWTIDLGELSPGNYGYKYLYDGTWEATPPPWSAGHWVDGFENRNLRVSDCTRPFLRVIAADADAQGNLAVEVEFLRAADGSPGDEQSLSVSVGGQAVPASWDASTGHIEVSKSDLASGKHTVRIEMADSAGSLAENSPLVIPLWVEQHEFIWQDGLIYFAFTDRFRNGDWDQPTLFESTPNVAPRADYLGGDFLGIIHALQEGYFSDLGVNTLWLSPVYENPEGGYLGLDGEHLYSGYHGYWPTSARQVEQRFGDAGATAEERLHELIDIAHSQGIRVLFDLVLNHVHQEHEYFVDHPDWNEGGCVCGTAGCDWEERALDCWFTDYLPDLNYRNHEIVQQVVDDVLWWVREFDVDAVRIDAAKHMDHVVMRTLRARLDSEVRGSFGAPLYLVGETFTGSGQHGLLMDYVSPWELDGQFDFPLYWQIRNTFAQEGSFTSLEESVQIGRAAYGDALMSPFLGNHDIPRFATEAAGNDLGPWGESLDWMAAGGGVVDQWDIINRLSMAFAFTLTQPGVPLIYYGDELGLAGSGDPDNRRMMTFAPHRSANQEELLRRVQAIGQVRAESAALRRGEPQTLWVDDTLLIYSMTTSDGDVAVVAMNKGYEVRTEVINEPALSAAGVLELRHGLGSGASIPVSLDGFELSLGAWEYAILLSNSDK